MSTAPSRQEDAASADPNSRARAGCWLLAAALLLYVGVCAWSWDQIEEDAFIYYRVAENLAAGEGFTFNAGEPPVECSSSIWFQVLLVPVVLLPMDVVTAAKLLGVLLGLGALLLTWRLARRLTGDPLLAALAPWVLACLLPFTLWSHRGLETPLYNCLLLAVALVACHPRLQRWWFLAVFLLVPMRPEGFLVAGAAVVALLPRRTALGGMGRGVLGLLLLCVAFLGWRLWYFHDLVPNPFYTKFQGTEARGWSALATVFVQGDLLWLVVPAAAAALVPRRWSPDEVLVLGLLGVTVLWAGLGEDWKPYNRHLVPALPFLAVMVVACLKPLARGRVGRGAVAAYVLGAGLFVLLHGRAVHSFTLTWDNPLVSRAWQEPPTFWPERTPATDRIAINSQATTGRFLQQNYPQGLTVLYDQMGQTPWYAGPDKTFLDTLGLVRRAVGVSGFRQRHRDGLLGLYGRWSDALLTGLWPEEPRGLGKREVLEHLLAQEPDLILLHEALLRNKSSVQSRLLRHPTVQRDYRPRYLINRSVRVLERRGVEARQPLEVPAYCEVEER